MKIELGKRFWLALTAAILILTFFVVGRNFLHAVRILSLIHISEPTRRS